LPIHVTAAEGFANVRDTYEKGRPGYSPDAVAFLCQRLGVIGPSRVVDVGAGTGKFTRALVAAGVTPIAVEPVAEMRETFVAHTPGVEIVDGTAEAIPLPDNSADAIVVAQAFHWFNGHAALREARRVLKPLGGLGLVWNGVDRSVPWVDAIWREVDARRDDTPSAWSNEWKNAFSPDAGFSPLLDATFRHDQRTDRDGLVARITSISFVARGPQTQRDELIDHILRVCEETGLPERFVLPYNCSAYWCRRV
jgi:SAM-dependent methyltransferase